MNEFKSFDAVDILGKSSGSELWEEHFASLLHLVKDYVVKIREEWNIKLYGDDSSQFQSSAQLGTEGQSGKNMCQGGGG